MTVNEFINLLEQALDFYNSSHSGPQIDAGIDGGLHALRIDGQNIITVAQATTLLRQLYAVGYAPQTLTTAQKAQARRNIGAGEGTGGVIASATEPTDPAVSVWINTSGNTPVLYIKNTAGVWYPVPGLVGPPGPATGVNPNLLNNWYFAAPINQRGQTSYSGAGYGLDRWKNNSSNTTSQIIDGGVRVESSGALASGYLMMSQYLETAIIGQTVTCSVLVTDISGSVAMTFGNTTDTSDRITSTVISRPGLYTISGICESGPQLFGLSKRGSGANYVDIAAVKLELGTQQTLAHQDGNGKWVLNEIPDYGEQLVKCQRYFYALKNNSEYNTLFFYGFSNVGGKIRATFTLPVPMRATPVLTTDATIDAYANDGTSAFPITEASVVGSTAELYNNTNVFGIDFTAADAILRRGYTVLVRGRSGQLIQFYLSAEL